MHSFHTMYNFQLFNWRISNNNCEKLINSQNHHESSSLLIELCPVCEINGNIT